MKGKLIRDFEYDDLQTLALRLPDQLSMASFNLEDVIETYIDSGDLKSLIVNGECIAIIGLYEYWHGVGECYMLTGEGVEKNKIFFCKAIKALFEEYQAKRNLHRIQCTVHESNMRAFNWLIKFMGFTNEGLMKAYGPDKSDYYRLALCQH